MTILLFLVRYVLTSPRSLEACARMNVRPIQLLRKPIEDFIEENPGKAIPLLQVMNHLSLQEIIHSYGYSIYDIPIICSMFVTSSSNISKSNNGVTIASIYLP